MLRWGMARVSTRPKLVLTDEEKERRSTSPIQNRFFPRRPTGTDSVALFGRRDRKPDRAHLEYDTQERAEMDR